MKSHTLFPLIGANSAMQKSYANDRFVLYNLLKAAHHEQLVAITLTFQYGIGLSRRRDITDRRVHDLMFQQFGEAA